MLPFQIYRNKLLKLIKGCVTVSILGVHTLTAPTYFTHTLHQQHPHTLPSYFTHPPTLHPHALPIYTHPLYPPTAHTFTHCTHILYPHTSITAPTYFTLPLHPHLPTLTHILYPPTSPTYTSPTYFTNPHSLTAPTYFTIPLHPLSPTAPTYFTLPLHPHPLHLHTLPIHFTHSVMCEFECKECGCDHWIKRFCGRVKCVGAAGKVCGPYSQTDCVGFKRLAPGHRQTFLFFFFFFFRLIFIGKWVQHSRSSTRSH